MSGTLIDVCCAKSVGDLLGVFCHAQLPPFLAFRSFAAVAFLQAGSRSQSNHRSITNPIAPCSASRPIRWRKSRSRGDLLLQHLLAGIALDDHRLVEQELAALGVVTPDATTLRKGGGSAEQRAQYVQCLLHPIRLIDGLVAAIMARDEQHQQRRRRLCWHLTHRRNLACEDLHFFSLPVSYFLPGKSSERDRVAGLRGAEGAAEPGPGIGPSLASEAGSRPGPHWGSRARPLDLLHEAKDQAKKSGMYDKMQSGDPNDIFDAAEQYGKMFARPLRGARTHADPADVQDAHRNGQTSAARGRQGRGARGRRVAPAVERPAQAARRAGSYTSRPR